MEKELKNVAQLEIGSIVKIKDDIEHMEYAGTSKVITAIDDFEGNKAFTLDNELGIWVFQDFSIS